MILLKALTLFLPWFLRRLILNWFFGYHIHRDASIGFAWIFPEQLVMASGSAIGHLSVCKGLERVEMGEFALIGRLNWITGFPRSSKEHYEDQLDRRPQLIMGEHSAITNRHLIDCTNEVSIGAFSTFGGFRSQILTHSIDMNRNREWSEPVRIGKYCFIGTDCVLLGGSSLPDYSILGAKSLLNKQYSDTFWLFAGVPAKPIKQLASDQAYFTRKVGATE
jgi:acetyltransferase-like isoleucine patch superfamily enzyme